MISRRSHCRFSRTCALGSLGLPFSGTLTTQARDWARKFRWRAGRSRGWPSSLSQSQRAHLDAALVALARDPPEALLVHATPILGQNRATIVAFALEHRLPSFTSSALMAHDGFLGSYAPDLVALWRRAADFVDRILRGGNSAEMPVEQPTKFEFVINLKAARAIGLDVPRHLLVLADEVIE